MEVCERVLNLIKKVVWIFCVFVLCISGKSFVFEGLRTIETRKTNLSRLVYMTHLIFL